MKKISITIFTLILLSLFVFFNLGKIQNFTTELGIYRSFPAQTSPKTVSLTCNYHGKDLTVSETLYASIDKYYQSEPKKKIAYYTNKNKDFVFSYKEDDTIAELTGKIEKIGAENSLNADQTLDLAACFLQSIPYDSPKAAKVLDPGSVKYSYSELVPRYPYETLYDFTGICTDKSYLGAAIFKEMGYKTSLLEFDTDKHLSIGLGVPAGYGELGTNYAIMELTGEGFLTGDIPVIKNTGFAENTIGNLPPISNENVQTAEENNKLSKATGVDEISSGKDYTRITERTALMDKINSLKQQLEEQRAQVLTGKDKLDAAESQLKSYENNYKSNPSRVSYNQYLNAYNSYQIAYNYANSLINAYNSLVGKYNDLIEEYKNY
jgi:hypothetical protein